MINYSQNNEQEAILNYFSQNINASGHGGKYIEIGSYDPFKFSNTRALFEMGWKGVLVEPSPTCFARLKKEYENEMRIKLINSAIMPNDGSISFQDCSGDAIGTTDLNHKDKWERGAGVQYNTITVQGISMQKFINENGADTDFLSLDTEGTNYELFNLLPNDFLHRLKAICIEHDGFNVEMMDKLSGFGFKQALFNNENLIAVK
jgi:FkbM family methyltransferase